jgi:DNA replication protein DnaC
MFRKNNSASITGKKSLESECAICLDMGFVHPRGANGKVLYDQAVPCRCQVARVAEERKERLLKYCYLPAGTDFQTFNTFRPYTTKLRVALDAARAVADPSGELKWLTLISKVDRGKSHLAVAICREWLKRDMPARYVFVPDLLDELRAGYEREGDESFLPRMYFYKTVPMLVMDDLGSEKPSAWVVEKLTTIINSRYENGLHLVVTTNRALDNLPGDVENRIGSRLRRHCQGKVVLIDDAEEYTDMRER